MNEVLNEYSTGLTSVDTHLIDTRMREVAEDIAEVQSRHSDLRDYHLQESTKGREDSELVLVETETICRAEDTTFHDAGGE